MRLRRVVRGGEPDMRRSFVTSAGFVTGLAGLLCIAMPAIAAEAPKRGGTLTYMIPADAPPSFDAHRENTFATIHAVAPFYSVLIRVNPENPAPTTHFVCDVCAGIPEPTDAAAAGPLDPRRRQVLRRLDLDRRRRSGELEQDRRAATRHHQPAPRLLFDDRQGRGARPDHRRLPSQIRDRGVSAGARRPLCLHLQKGNPRPRPALVREEHPGVRPVPFKEYQLGQSISGVATPITTTRDCRISTASPASTPTSRRPGSARSKATGRRSSSAAFRRRPATNWSPRSATRSRFRRATGIAATLITPNHQRKPFDDVRVRRALTLAIDRWHGAAAMAKISVMRTVGGVAFPGSPLAATKEELQQIAGWWPDIEKSRAEARRLLKEAGQENLSFELLNRNVDQPYNSMPSGSSTSGARSGSR